MSRSTFLFSLLLLSGLLLSSGCSTTGRYQVNIGNGNSAGPAIQQVEVRLDGSTLKTFPKIGPQKIAATKPRRGDLPETVTLAWMDTEGQTHNAELRVSETVPPDFTGQLVIQINPDNTLLLKPDPAREDDLSPIPWNAPEAWEGSVMIPGFNE